MTAEYEYGDKVRILREDEAGPNGYGIINGTCEYDGVTRYWVTNLNMPFMGTISEFMTADMIEPARKGHQPKQDVRYYIVNPNGRQKISAKNDEDARAEYDRQISIQISIVKSRVAFFGHSTYVAKNPKFRLVKEVRTVMAEDAI